MGAARYGDRPAIADERGPLSFAELDARSDAIARGLIETGVRAGDTVGVLCRNHRGFFEITGRAGQARGERAVPQYRVRRTAGGTP